MVVVDGIEGGGGQPSPASPTPDVYTMRRARLFVSEKPAVVTAWCALLLLVIAGGAVFYAARAYLLPVTAAFVLSVLLAPVVNLLEARRVPRGVASALSVVGVCALIYVAIALVAAPAARWAAQAPEVIAEASEQIERLQSAMERVEEITNEVADIAGNGQNEAAEVVVQGPGLTQAIASSAGAIVVQTLFVLVMTYFFLLTRAEIRLKMIAAQPKLSGRLHMARVFRDVERGVAVYITTLATVNLGVGVAVGLAMWAAGMPSPVMWGGLAAALNFIPYVGPALLTVLLAIGGFATFDTVTGALIPPAIWIVVNFVESNIVTPTVVGKRMTLNPLAVLLAVSFWTWIWGPLGGVLSIPMLIMLKVMCDHASSLRPFASFIGGPLPRRTRLAAPKTPRTPRPGADARRPLAARLS